MPSGCCCICCCCATNICPGLPPGLCGTEYAGPPNWRLAMRPASADGALGVVGAEAAPRRGGSNSGRAQGFLAPCLSACGELVATQAATARFLLSLASTSGAPALPQAKGWATGASAAGAASANCAPGAKARDRLLRCSPLRRLCLLGAGSVSGACSGRRELPSQEGVAGSSPPRPSEAYVRPYDGTLSPYSSSESCAAPPAGLVSPSSSRGLGTCRGGGLLLLAPSPSSSTDAKSVPIAVTAAASSALTSLPLSPASCAPLGEAVT